MDGMERRDTNDTRRLRSATGRRSFDPNRNRPNLDCLRGGCRGSWTVEMTTGDYLVAAVGLLQLAASLSYALKKQWAPAAIWIGAAIISFSTLYLSVAARR